MRWLLLVMTLALVPACSAGELMGDESCELDGQPVVDVLERYAEEWDDALNVAQGTSRIALPAQVSDMQEIRRDFRREEWPACAEPATDALTSYMDGVLDALIAFMSQEPESKVQSLIKDATEHLDTFQDELDAIED